MSNLAGCFVEGRGILCPECVEKDRARQSGKGEVMDLENYIDVQRLWSKGVFGDGLWTGGLIEHIRSECDEVLANPSDVGEWVDIVILALDGAWRVGLTSPQICDAMMQKQLTNLDRRWPKPVSEDAAVYHIHEVAGFEEEKYHELSARFFCELARRTVFATGTDSTARYALGGVLLEMDEKGITAVATDGRRLAVQECPAESVGGHETGDRTVLVPARTMHLIELALADNEANIQLAVCGDEVLVKSGRTTISSKLLKGRYPKWRDVLPCGDGTMVRIKLQVGPFLSAVQQAAIVTSEERPSTTFTFGGGKVVLAGCVEEMGESHVEMPIAYDGPAVTIKLNPRYVADFLKVFDPETTFALEVFPGQDMVWARFDDGYSYVLCGIG